MEKELDLLFNEVNLVYILGEYYKRTFEIIINQSFDNKYFGIIDSYTREIVLSDKCYGTSILRYDENYMFVVINQTVLMYDVETWNVLNKRDGYYYFDYRFYNYGIIHMKCWGRDFTDITFYSLDDKELLNLTIEIEDECFVRMQLIDGIPHIVFKGGDISHIINLIEYKETGELKEVYRS
jgi:hypothetical protein